MKLSSEDMIILFPTKVSEIGAVQSAAHLRNILCDAHDTYTTLDIISPALDHCCILSTSFCSTLLGLILWTQVICLLFFDCASRGFQLLLLAIGPLARLLVIVLVLDI
jgi:hypothetical protein